MPSSSIRRALGVRWRRTSGRVLLSGRTQGHDAELTGAGPAIWIALEQQPSVEALITDLIDRYNAEPPTIEQDVKALVESLRAAGFVESDDD